MPPHLTGVKTEGIFFLLWRTLGRSHLIHLGSLLFARKIIAHYPEVLCICYNQFCPAFFFPNTVKLFSTSRLLSIPSVVILLWSLKNIFLPRDLSCVSQNACVEALFFHKYKLLFRSQPWFPILCWKNRSLCHLYFISLSSFFLIDYVLLMHYTAHPNPWIQQLQIAKTKDFHCMEPAIHQPTPGTKTEPN